MGKNNKFSLSLCSDLEYEGMVVDINYENTRIAIINYEKGIDSIEIEFLNIGKNKKRSPISLNDFQKAIDESIKILNHCAEEDKHR